MKTGILVRVFFAVILASVIAGCAATGGIPGIKEGETSRSEVRDLLGEPDSRTSGGEVWHYRFVRSGEGAGTVLNLDITFNRGVVKGYEITVSKTGAKGGKKGVVVPPRPLPLPRPLPPRFPPPPY